MRLLLESLIVAGALIGVVLAGLLLAGVVAGDACWL